MCQVTVNNLTGSVYGVAALSETMAKDMTLLWGHGSPDCWRVMIALEEKGLQGYNQTLLSFQKGENKSQQVMDMNPRGRLPSFKHGDRVLNESYAACMYMENQFKSQGNQLIPDDPDELALMYQRMMEGLVLHQESRDVIFYNSKIPESERLACTFKRHKEALTAEVQLWEGYLEKVAPALFLAGQTFSLADVTVYPNVFYLFCFGLCKKKYPYLAAYYERLKSRPSIKATWPPDWVENPKGSDLLKEI